MLVTSGIRQRGDRVELRGLRKKERKKRKLRKMDVCENEEKAVRMNANSQDTHSHMPKVN